VHQLVIKEGSVPIVLQKWDCRVWIVSIWYRRGQVDFLLWAG